MVSEPDLGFLGWSNTDYNQLNVIKKFEINKEVLRKEFLDEENKEKRQWFFETFSQEELRNYRENYYKHLENIQENIPYFKWFEENYLDKLTVNVIKYAEKIWKTSKGEISSIVPPLEDISFQNIQNKEVKASPFKMITEERTEIKIKDIQNIHSQLNYTNQLLHQMASTEGEVI